MNLIMDECGNLLEDNSSILTGEKFVLNEYVLVKLDC